MGRAKVQVLSKKATQGLMKENLFRFTNKTENHHGFKYNIGLNVDVHQLNKWGDCCSGGLYFYKGSPVDFISRANDYLRPVYIRSVTIPEGETVVRNEGKYRARRVILGKRERITDYMIRNEEQVNTAVPVGEIMDIFVRVHGKKGMDLFVKHMLKPWQFKSAFSFDRLNRYFVRKKKLLPVVNIHCICRLLSERGVKSLVMKSLEAGAEVEGWWGGIVDSIAMSDPDLFVKLLGHFTECYGVSKDLTRACAVNPQIFEAMLNKFGYDSQPIKSILSTADQYGVLPRRAVDRMRREVAKHA